MNTNVKVLIAVFVGSFVLAKPSAAATDIYLQIPGFPGEATAAHFRGDIPLLSYSQSVQAPATYGSTGLQGAKPSCGQIVFTKHLDTASPLLIRAAISGHHILQATISFVDTQGNGGAPQINYVVTLNDVVLTSVQQSDSSPAQLTESVSLIASSFSVDYLPFTVTGAAATPQQISVNCASLSTQ